MGSGMAGRGRAQHRRTHARTALIGLVAMAAAASACIPQPAGPTTTTTWSTVPTAPTVDSFAVKGTPGPAPALVNLAWSVYDANGDPLTCHIDADGNGVFELTVANCQTPGSRNLAVAAPTTVTARIRVEDGSFAPVEATTEYTVTAGSSEPFDIVLRGVEALSPQVASAFQTAVDRWESVIVRGIPDVSTVPSPSCLPDGLAPLPAVIDDLIVDVSTPAIDGSGGILGQAGPTCVPLSVELGFHGIMQFDSADVADMVAEGTLTDVITHELGHVLGIGVLWDMSWHPQGVRRLLSGAGSSNPIFTGPRAVAEWRLLGGSGSVPVENSGGSGTRDSHWRELTFGNELMTGYISYTSNPLSRMSIASLADMGYRVDVTQADSYQLGNSAVRRTPTEVVEGEMIRPPVGIG